MNHYIITSRAKEHFDTRLTEILNEIEQRNEEVVAFSHTTTIVDKIVNKFTDVFSAVIVVKDKVAPKRDLIPFDSALQFPDESEFRVLDLGGKIFVRIKSRGRMAEIELDDCALTQCSDILTQASDYLLRKGA